MDTKKSTTLIGLLRRSDIGPGVWVLSTPVNTIELSGSIPEELIDCKVQAQGALEPNFSMFAISELVLIVSKIEAV